LSAESTLLKKRTAIKDIEKNYSNLITFGSAEETKETENIWLHQFSPDLFLDTAINLTALLEGNIQLFVTPKNTKNLIILLTEVLRNNPELHSIYLN
jgi:hypothetical protein